MNTNRHFLLVAAVILSGAFCAAAAMADTQAPQPYHGLTAVTLAPGQSPRLARGFSDLGGSERRYGEKLPVQLSGAIKKIKATKYTPKQSKKHQPVRRAKANRS